MIAPGDYNKAELCDLLISIIRDLDIAVSILEFYQKVYMANGLVDAAQSVQNVLDVVEGGSL